jgi:hypothetical protein
MGDKTLRDSALPYLSKAGLIRWRKGRKSGEPGSLVLFDKTYRLKGSPHDYKTVSFANPRQTLEMLRLLIRMRSGVSKRAPLMRMGPSCMFVVVAMLGSPSSCGHTASELEETTGRRKTLLVRTYLPRLKEAGVIQEKPAGSYRLTRDFEDRWLRHLRASGITDSEHSQRRRYERSRKAREDQRQGASEKAQKAEEGKVTNLRGPDHIKPIIQGRQSQAEERWTEEVRRKVGTTPRTFLEEVLKGVPGMALNEAMDRWIALGGKPVDLKQAVWFGPYELRYEGPVEGPVRVIYRNPARERKPNPPPPRKGKSYTPDMDGRPSYEHMERIKRQRRDHPEDEVER